MIAPRGQFLSGGRYLTAVAVHTMPDIGGLPIVRNPNLTPGMIYVVFGEFIYMHPLDVLTLEYPDPLDRLEAGSSWILEQGRRKWERVSQAIRADGVADRLAIASSAARKFDAMNEAIRQMGVSAEQAA